MKTLAEYPLAELKLIYSLLHAQLPANPVLMDSELLHDLQTHLQRAAKDAGIDVTLHARWTSWLAGATVLKEIKRPQQ